MSLAQTRDILGLHSFIKISNTLITMVMSLPLMSYAHEARRETIDTLTPLVCAPLSSSKPVSGYHPSRPIPSAMLRQTSAASEPAVWRLLNGKIKSVQRLRDHVRVCPIRVL